MFFLIITYELHLSRGVKKWSESLNAPGIHRATTDIAIGMRKRLRCHLISQPLIYYISCRTYIVYASLTI